MPRSSYYKLITMAVAALIGAMRPGECQTVAALLPRLLSNDAATRMETFDRLSKLSASQHVAVCTDKATEQVKLGLIAALKKESVEVIHGHRQLSDAEVDEYYPNLLGCVGALHDARAASVIADGLETGGIAMAGLASLGDAGVAAAIETLRQSDNAAARHAAAMVLGNMAAGKMTGPGYPARGVATISTESRQAIRAALLASAVRDKDIIVRSRSVQSLAPFADAEVRATVARLQSADTGFVFPGSTSGSRRFPVREAARRWLQQDSVRLRAKMP